MKVIISNISQSVKDILLHNGTHAKLVPGASMSVECKESSKHFYDKFDKAQFSIDCNGAVESKVESLPQPEPPKPDTTPETDPVEPSEPEVTESESANIVDTLKEYSVEELKLICDALEISTTSNKQDTLINKILDAADDKTILEMIELIKNENK